MLLTLVSEASARGAVQIPEECGTQEEFTRQLERLLGDQAAEGQPLSLQITPRDAAGGYTLRMQLRDEVRELRDPDCRALFRSAVVIAAAAVRPDLYDAASLSAEASEPPASQGPQASPPLSQAAVPPPPKRQTSTGEDAAWRVSVHAGAAAVAGLLPGVSLMLEAGAAIDYRRWGLVAAMRYLPGTGATEETGRGVDVQAIGAQLAGLFEPHDVLRISAGLTVHRLEGKGFGVAQSLTDTAWSMSPTAELALIPLRTNDLRVEFGLQVHTAVVQPRFQIAGFGEIYRAPRFGGAAVMRVGFWLM